MNQATSLFEAIIYRQPHRVIKLSCTVITENQTFRQAGGYVNSITELFYLSRDSLSRRTCGIADRPSVVTMDKIVGADAKLWDNNVAGSA